MNWDEAKVDENPSNLKKQTKGDLPKKNLDDKAVSKLSWNCMVLSHQLQRKKTIRNHTFILRNET